MMTQQTNQGFVQALDQAIDLALRIVPVSTADSAEVSLPTTSSKRHSIEGSEDFELLECSADINNWNPDVYRAFLRVKIDLLCIAQRALVDHEQLNEISTHIDRLSVLHETLGSKQHRSVVDVLDSEQRKLVHLGEDAPLGQILKTFTKQAKTYVDAYGTVIQTLSAEMQNNAEKKFSPEDYWAGISLHGTP